MSLDWRCEMRTNLELFQDFMDYEIRDAERAKGDRVYSHAAEYFCDAMTGTLHKTPEEYREWLIALMEAFRDARMDTIGTLLYTTVYQDIIKDYETGKLEFLDYEN